MANKKVVEKKNKICYTVTIKKFQEYLGIFKI